MDIMDVDRPATLGVLYAVVAVVLLEVADVGLTLELLQQSDTGFKEIKRCLDTSTP